MAEQPVRIGFIGAGGIVRTRHAPGLRSVPGVEFKVVANRSQESSERAAKEFGVERTARDWREVIEAPDVDAVWIGTHPYMHREITVAALEHGKHVFCQARMAMDYKDAKAMWEASEKYPHLTTMLCPPPHYMRGDRVIRRMLREGFVGQPLNVVVQSYADSYADPSTPILWRQVGSISGVNTLDVGMMVEIMHRWLGFAKRVTAFDKTFYPTRPDGQGGTAPVERPDTLSAVAELESGALATLTWSGVARHAAEANAFEIYGSEGTIRYLFGMDKPGQGKILAGKASDSGLKEVEIPESEARSWTVEQDFVEGVRAGKHAVEPTFWDGLKYMEITEAIFRSAETGRAVDLPFEQLTPKA
jgi:predicted dehydrogenase